MGNEKGFTPAEMLKMCVGLEESFKLMSDNLKIKADRHFELLELLQDEIQRQKGQIKTVDGVYTDGQVHEGEIIEEEKNGK